MASAGRLPAMLWAVVAVAHFYTFPAFADDAVTDGDDVFAAWQTMPEDDLREQSGGQEIEVNGDLGLNIGITEGSIDNSSADNTMTGYIYNNPVTGNRGINQIDFNTGNNVIIQKNANINIFMR